MSESKTSAPLADNASSSGVACSKPMNGISAHTDTSSVTPESTRRSQRKRRSKYRHVAAYHSEVRHSSLSRDSDASTSFLGFRNLMVIVLGREIYSWSPIASRANVSARASGDEPSIDH